LLKPIKFIKFSNPVHKIFKPAGYHQIQKGKIEIREDKKMNKILLSIALVTVVVVALGSAGFVYAQSTTPPTPVPGTSYNAQMGGHGIRGGMWNQNGAAGTQTGLLHDAMISVFAEKLGFTVDELNSRLANGETMAQIAAAEGLSVDEFRILMIEARTQAIDQAVQDGTLTQEQADWMKLRGVRMAAGLYGMRGAGMGGSVNPDCPYLNQTNP